LRGLASSMDTQGLMEVSGSTPSSGDGRSSDPIDHTVPTALSQGSRSVRNAGSSFLARSAFKVFSTRQPLNCCLAKYSARVWFHKVNEAYSTQAWSACCARSGIRGCKILGKAVKKHS